ARTRPHYVRAPERVALSRSIRPQLVTRTRARVPSLHLHSGGAKDENGHCPGSSPRTASQSWIAFRRWRALQAGRHLRQAPVAEAVRTAAELSGSRTVAHGVLI